MSLVSHQPGPDRKLRAGMVLLLVVAGTALIGWGGLAAWQAVTQNNGSTAITEGVHMQNVATVTGGHAVPCTDENSPGACGAVFDVSGINPGFGPAQVGTVTITNTGSESSVFVLELSPSAPPTVSAAPGDTYWTSADNTLCTDLVLTVKDQETTPHVVYSGSLAAMPTESIVDNGGNSTWAPGATDTYSFSLALPAGSPNTDEDSTCAATFTWAETGA